MSNKGRNWYGFVRTICIGIGALTATNTDEYAAFVAPCKCKIKKLGVVFDDTITGAASDNFGVRFKNKGPSGTGTDVMATRLYASGTDATQFDLEDLGTVSYADLNEGDVVTFEKFENASGANMSSVLAIIEVARAE